MEMGELAGTEIARRLRSANPGLHLVFVTGYADRILGGYLAIQGAELLGGFHFLHGLDAVNQYWQGLGWGSRIF